MEENTYYNKMAPSTSYQKINPVDYGIITNHKEIILGNNLFSNFHEIIRSLYPNSKYLIVTDKNIYENVISRFPNIKKEHHLLTLPSPLKAELLIADKIANNFNNYDIAIAIGSGTINDLVKYGAHKAKKPYITFATSPSMNGYLSKNSSLLSNGHKQSYIANSPIAAYFDIDILTNSPLRMIKSGLGDSLCTHTIRADWLLSHHLIGTKYSELPFDIIKQLEIELFQNIDKLNNKDPETITILTKILILSGLSMLHIGDSSPASQGEHMIAHLYEILDPNNSNKSLHGEQIAFTCLYMTKLQEEFLNHKEAPKVKPQHIKIKDFSFLPKNLRTEFYRQCKKSQILDAKKINLKLNNIWQDLKTNILSNYKSSELLLDILNKSNLPSSIHDLEWEPSTFETTKKNTQLTRNRFTFLNLEK